jgi:hypothetical protein
MVATLRELKRESQSGVFGAAMPPSANVTYNRIEGRSHFCRLAPAPLAAADEWLRFYERFWSGQLDALDAALRAEAAQRTMSSDKRGADT